MKFGLPLFLFILLFASPFELLAQGSPIAESFSYASQIGGEALGANPLQKIIVSIINVVLSFTAIIFTGITLYGGALYATSHVNEEERAYAMATMRSGIIGMAFIIFSMSISKFVLSSVSAATGSSALTF